MTVKRYIKSIVKSPYGRRNTPESNRRTHEEGFYIFPMILNIPALFGIKIGGISGNTLNSGQTEDYQQSKNKQIDNKSPHDSELKIDKCLLRTSHDECQHRQNPIERPSDTSVSQKSFCRKIQSKRTFPIQKFKCHHYHYGHKTWPKTYHIYSFAGCEDSKLV